MSFSLNNQRSPAPSAGEHLYEPYEDSLAVFRTVEGRYGLTFRKCNDIVVCNNEEGAYKMLKSLFVHFGQLNDGKDIPVPAELKDIDIFPIDYLINHYSNNRFWMREGNLISFFETVFDGHWRNIPYMKFKKFPMD